MSARGSAEWGLRLPLLIDVCVDVLIPNFERPSELAVTLAGLAAQTDVDFRVVIADQSETAIWKVDAVMAMVRVLRAQGRPVDLLRNLPRRGMAQQRQFLLEHSSAPRVLYLDSDVWLEPGGLAHLVSALDRSGGGFVGSAVQGLSYLEDERPEEWEPFERWQSDVQPEPMPRVGPAHERWKLHNAANLTHIAAREVKAGRLVPGQQEVYKVAWVGGCVLFDRAILEECGGFSFWDQLPDEHAGEDVLAQWRVLETHGGSGLVPSVAVHLEAPTTVTDRRTEATELLD